MSSDDQEQNQIIRIPWVEGETTPFVVAMLAQFKLGNRVTCLVQRGQSEAVIARIRVRLSRARNELRRKGYSLRLFDLSIVSYPYTNGKGKTYDCLVLKQKRDKRHEIQERLKEMINANFAGNAESQQSPTTTQTAKPRRELPEW